MSNDEIILRQMYRQVWHYERMVDELLDMLERDDVDAAVERLEQEQSQIHGPRD